MRSVRVGPVTRALGDGVRALAEYARDLQLSRGLLGEVSVSGCLSALIKAPMEGTV